MTKTATSIWTNISGIRIFNDNVKFIKIKKRTVSVRFFVLDISIVVISAVVVKPTDDVVVVVVDFVVVVNVADLAVV